MTSMSSTRFAESVSMPKISLVKRFLLSVACLHFFFLKPKDLLAVLFILRVSCTVNTRTATNAAFLCETIEIYIKKLANDTTVRFVFLENRISVLLKPDSYCCC